MATKALTETYESVKKLIYHTCLKWVARFGGDLDEAVSAANEIFMRVYFSFDSSKSSFTNWLVRSIFQGLSDIRRKEIKRAGLLGNRVNEYQVSIKEGFNLSEFTSDLSSDAACVIRLLLETNKRNQPMLMKCLRGLGWSVERVLESFAEIHNLLCGE